MATVTATTTITNSTTRTQPPTTAMRLMSALAGRLRQIDSDRTPTMGKQESSAKNHERPEKANHQLRPLSPSPSQLARDRREQHHHHHQQHQQQQQHNHHNHHNHRQPPDQLSHLSSNQEQPVICGGQQASEPHHTFRQVSAIPPLPQIKTPHNQSERLTPLGVEEYERDYRRTASDQQLVERIYLGGIAGNKLRAILWPYLFGLVEHRGRFKLSRRRKRQQPQQYHYTHTNGRIVRRTSEPLDGRDENGTDKRQNENAGRQNGHFINEDDEYDDTQTDDEDEDADYAYVEHEENVKRWRELERLYNSYLAQWQSVMPDQELRFSTFRERKALIERDVIRSDRSHPFYADNNQNLTSFSTLLMTYMMYDFDIGYLQGMSDLAAPILYVFNGDPVKSFWVFVEVMKLLRRNFEYSQKTIHFQLNTLYRLIKLTDPKFGQYLKENECSNCFFVFRSIVCQFKRELMKNDDEDDYTRVLRLWDTIWSVQRRHELLSKSKIVHTFTIANGHSKSVHLHRGQLNVHKLNQYQNGRRADRQWSASNGTRLASSPRTTNVSSANGHNGTNETKCNGQTNGATVSSDCNTSNERNNNNNGHQNGYSSKQVHSLTSSCNGTLLGKTAPRTQLQSSSLSLKGDELPVNGKSNGISANGRAPTQAAPMAVNKCYGHLYAANGHVSDTSSPFSSPSPASPVSMNGHSRRSASERGAPSRPVKQEQVVYTKETFYSSFDPNQADIPRFELTETEKFVLSLCLSLIRRERNQILLERLDASEIHQHFINPRLASDLDNFIEGAYQIYDFLNTDCDLQLLVKGANQAAAGEMSPAGVGVDVPLAPGARSSHNDTADTYDLLKDYLIISPSSYSTSRCKFSVSQKSWDHFLNHRGTPAD